MDIKITSEVEMVAGFIANKIINQIDLGKKVLFFASGGSAIAVTSEMAKIIKQHSHQNLTVILADERFGSIGHKDSNWQQLLDKGFDLPQAKLIPIITGKDIIETTQEFNVTLEKELKKADYKIGLFGVGKDGHTAGILRNSEAVKSQNWACSHVVPPFERVTITTKTILKLDEAVLWAQGNEKWKIIEELRDDDIDINTQPAQILKKVPILTIFTDYPGSRV
ncbi:MAG: 6-phosphogluconolactonase [Candidatus Paceibacterota bacterium]|jgi:6-phosphogluconolactonase/glucosamine-6-phosphate isomerase/deaminase